MPAERITCIDHDIVDCPDCGQWLDEMDARDDRHAAEVSALRAELKIARSDLDRARSVAERETARRIVVFLRNLTLRYDPQAVADAVERNFGGEDKGGGPRQ